MPRLALAAVLMSLTLLGTSALVTPAPASAATPIRVHGTVTSPAGTPIAGVVWKVVLRGSTAGFVSTHGRTDAAGRYSGTLPSGRGDRYQLVVTDPGDDDRDPSDGRWAPVSKRLTTGSEAVSIDATLQPGATLSGHVTDSAGRPLPAGQEVRAWLVTGERNDPAWGDPGSTTFTRAGGAYRFSNLSAGTAAVFFTSDGSGDETEHGGWYDGSVGGSSREDASTIALTAGGTASGVDFRFAPKPRITVTSRTVTDPAGDAPTAIDVTRVRVRNGTRSLVVRTTMPGFTREYDRGPSGCEGFTGLTLAVHLRGATGKGYVRPGEFLVEVGPECGSNPIDDVLISRYTEDELASAHCAGLRAHVVDGGITTIVPQRCFGPVKGKGAGGVTVSASAGGNVGSVFRSDATATTHRLARG